ncbi:hypothetical protein [Rhodococcus opacus]|uniref:hypothetical protein n=1 Tax=Rhodococcus opacus TaxID=37919 RepID=UPI002235A4C1|nr:hypothetical protein [Rhodococcus opacus]UZG58024.1 hypothetical protein ONE62_12260 [Rhodococcus opacus]
MATQKTLSTKEAADKLGTDPKSLRVFLRTPEGIALVERDGARYVIPAANVPKIAKGLAAHAKRAEERKAKEAAEPDLEPEDDDTTPDDEPEELEELGEDEEPTDEEDDE